MDIQIFAEKPAFSRTQRLFSVCMSPTPAPKSPELRLEPMNCTTIAVQWQQDAEDPAAVQGYKLYYKEEGQQENGPILLDASDLEYTVSGLGECTEYFPTLLEDSDILESLNHYTCKAAELGLVIISPAISFAILS